MHFINQDANRFRIRMLIDAVTKVKDVAAIANLAEAVDQSGSFIGKKNGWIEVALKSHRICTQARALVRFTVQSRPIQSAPVAAISLSHKPPPLVKRMTGTFSPSFSRMSPSTICFIYFRLNASKQPSAKAPPQVSKIWTA